MLGMAATLDLQIAAGLLHRDRGPRAGARAPAAPTWPAGCGPTGCTRRRSASRRSRTSSSATASRPSGAPPRRLALAPDDLDINAAIWGQVRAHDGAARRRPARGCWRRWTRPRTTCGAARARPRRRSAACGRWSARCPARTATRPGPRPAPSSVNWENAALLGYAEAVDARPPGPQPGGRPGSSPPPTGRWPAALVAAPDPAAGRRRRAHRRLGRPGRLGPGGAAGLRRPRRDPAGQPLPRGAAAGRCAGPPPGPRRHPGAAGAAGGRRDQPRGRRAAADGRGPDQHRDRAEAGALAAHDRDARREPGRQDRRAQPGRAGRAGPVAGKSGPDGAN